MASCEEHFEELLDRFVEGGLEESEREEFESLLSENPEWRARAEEERRLVDMMRRAGGRKAPEGLFEAVMDELAEDRGGAEFRVATVEEVPSSSRKGHRILWPMAAAAAVLAAGALAYFSTQGPGPESRDMALLTEEPERFRAEQRQQEFARRPASESSRAKEQSLGDEVPAQKAATPVSLPGLPSAGVASSSAFESSESQASPAEIEVLLSREGGRLLIDTASRETAEHFFSGEGELPEWDAPQPGDEAARYMVIEAEDAESREEIALSFQNQFGGLDGEELASAKMNQNRIMFSYGSRGRGPVADAGTTASPRAKKSVDHDLMKEKATEADSVDQMFASAPAPRAEASVPAVETFEEFLDRMSDSGGQFLFYTSDRPVAFHKYSETADLLAQAGDADGQDKDMSSRRISRDAPKPEATPTAEPIPTLKPGFTGFLVFHFDSTEKASAALRSLPKLHGEGVEHIDAASAELLSQPMGARLIVPYRMRPLDEY